MNGFQVASERLDIAPSHGMSMIELFGIFLVPSFQIEQPFEGLDFQETGEGSTGGNPVQGRLFHWVFSHSRSPKKAQQGLVAVEETDYPSQEGYGSHQDLSMLPQFPEEADNVVGTLGSPGMNNLVHVVSFDACASLGKETSTPQTLPLLLLRSRPPQRRRTMLPSPM
jgi:hypothetical protein